MFYSEMSSYKLLYFDMRGMGEVIRLLFALADVPYEDQRLSREEWELLKPETLFGQLPILVVDGKMLPQSYAIYRYLSNEFGYAGKSAYERALVDSIADAQKDVFQHLLAYFMAKAGNSQGDPELIFEERVKPAIDTHFPLLVQRLKESGSGFFAESGITWVDLVVSEQLSTFRNFKPDALARYPELEQHIETVHSVPQIQKWHSIKPPSQY
ncbi:hypothetical protein QR680_001146 [Steinernema hermaphroditum]|uniref:glutathione transferase n=1 Tax=Steinernema hermaphroditum TaxID=289476 RepID=A0AA39GXV7_9BILA|nr:hypothetical protein QR680_001146 [Steinernema hermaphroditum]